MEKEWFHEKGFGRIACKFIFIIRKKSFVTSETNLKGVTGALVNKPRLKREALYFWVDLRITHSWLSLIHI